MTYPNATRKPNPFKIFTRIPYTQQIQGGGRNPTGGIASLGSAVSHIPQFEDTATSLVGDAGDAHL